MKTSSIRIGIIGAGFGKNIHVPGFRAVPGATVAGLAGANADKTAHVASELGIPRAYRDWRDMMDDAEIDAVSIATPPDLHAPIAMHAAAMKKAVLCEKPMAMNGMEGRAMLEAVRREGVAHLVHFEFRTVPHFRRLKELIEEGCVGSIRLVQITWHVQSWADANRAMSWQCDAERGGGVISALGCHAFDYIRWLFGPVQTVAAQTHIRIGSRPATAEHRTSNVERQSVTAEDTVCGSLELTDGTPVVFSISNVVHAGRGHRIEVFGERGTLILGSSNLKDYVHGFKLWHAADGQADPQEPSLPDRLRFPREFPDGRMAPFVAMARQFAEAVRTGRNAPPSFEDGLESQKVCDAVKQSAREGKTIHV